MAHASIPRKLTILELPTEIHEHIASFLNHLPSFKSCSLTCKAWLRPSWKALFEHCTVLVHRRNIDAFLELITLNNLNEDLTIIPFIRHLYIEQGGSNRFPPIRAYVEWGADDDHEHDQPSIIDSGSDYEIFQFDDFLHRLVGLSAVRSLKLGWVRCDTTELTSAALRKNFAGVTSLNLDSVILSSPVHFFDILNAFPLLSSLSLTGVLFNGGRLYDGLDNWEKLDARRTNLETTPPPPPHLRKLQLDATEDVTEFLFSWMAYHDTPLPMQSLECGLFSSSSNAALSKFLACSGSTIEDLLFHDAREPTRLDLSPCINLQRLEISCIPLQSSTRNGLGEQEGPREPGSIMFITDILQTVTSHRTKQIKISLSISDFEDTDDQIYAFDWRGLMLSLGRDQFSSLESVIISVPRSPTHQVRIQRVMTFHSQLDADIAGQHPGLIDKFKFTEWARSDQYNQHMYY
ncbi:hypothetical protein F5878DRAFT_606126 [Lentinula raphanica]|uniref:F-box domain-containing protein n=1 Tax=Lentinula raphanica TaxID=153919 RepID=A0AA38UIG3_9AGAR|nr:hypothetical protein F5878DRAFT_606126 [Lentinula raphanica]